MSVPALEVTDLTVRHGGVVAVDGVSLRVDANTVTGLIGPNGAGKTSLLDAITGFATVESGEVAVFGRAATGLAPHRLARLGVSRTFQSMELFDDLSVAENLRVAGNRPRWWSMAAEVVGSTRSEAGGESAIRATIDELGLSGVADRRPESLSNGQRHLVALARALVSRPELLLLDEPAAGLDTSETAQLASIVAELPARGVSVLLVDHDMGLVLGVCDQVHVLDRGRLLASGTPDEVRRDQGVIDAYLGVSG
ncbi:MAG TPA: ABC transporter ATP-binding protein [Microthrixaceae bacterium]|nr:ABC transporter ATP-binding protein [Microthrixaceae bacterium]